MSDTGAAQAFYGRWASLYDRLARFPIAIGPVREATVDALGLDRGDTVVEMGCGTGANLPLLRDAVGPEGTVIGVDYTRATLNRAAVSLDRSGTSSGQGYDDVQLVHGDVTALPVDGPVDAILATFVVGMLDTPAAVIDDWWELLAPGGHLVLCNAHASQNRIGRLLSPVFRAAVVCSTPPTTQIRYDDDLVELLDNRVQAAHDRLRERAAAVADEQVALGYVSITGGRTPE